MPSIDLPKTLAEITPVLERAIQTDRECFSSLVDTDLQLRMPYCGIACRSIQIYFDEKHGIDSQVGVNEKVPVKFIHTTLIVDEIVVDPTHGQFMEVIGLTHKTAVDYDIKHLYPNPKIATFATAEGRKFADDFTDHLLEVYPELPMPIQRGPLSPFAQKNLRRVFRNLWNIDNYTPHSYDAPHFHRITRRVADQLIDEV